MEEVALSDQQLTYLTQQDPILKSYFQGVLASDQLPMSPSKRTSAYIVNTDPHDKPGRHWIAFWTDQGICEIMDSYGLPLQYYQARPLERWTKKWKYIVSNGRALQSLTSKACGHYCLFYLKAKSKGYSMQDFLTYFSKKDYVANDHQVGEMLQKLITNPKTWREASHRPMSQTCTSCQ